MSDFPSVLLYPSDPERDQPAAIKIQTPDWEVNVSLSDLELSRLADLRAASWDERRSIRAGTSAGASVFWCADADRVVVMIGHDDETWDISFSFPGIPSFLQSLGLGI